MKVDEMELASARIMLERFFRETFYQELSSEGAKMVLSVMGVKTVDEAVTVRVNMILDRLTEIITSDRNAFRQEMASNALDYIREADWDAYNLIMIRLMKPSINPLLSPPKASTTTKSGAPKLAN